MNENVPEIPDFLSDDFVFASDVSFGIIKHLLTRYSENSKFIKLLTFHLRTPICIKHTPKWQKNINKYKKCM